MPLATSERTKQEERDLKPLRTLSGNGAIWIIICGAIFMALLSGTPSKGRAEKSRF